MTDNEIIKALEDLIKNFDGKAVDFMTISFALDLVNRQKAENKELISKLDELESEYALYKISAQEQIEALDAEIESITEKFNCQQTVYADLSKIIKDKNVEIKTLQEQIVVLTPPYIAGVKESAKQIKSEAVKEFAERLKKLSRNLYPFSDEPIIDCKDVDNLVKEMVGDNNA